MDKLFLLSNDKVGQTSTISENSNHFQQDWVLVKPGEAFEFPAIKGPTYISNLAITGWPGEPNSNLKWIMDRLEKGQFLKQLLFTDVSYLQSVDIKIYFDDATIPNVDSTFANFFGAGFGRYTPYDSLYLGMTSGEFYSRFPMPFKESCVVKIENKGNENLILFGEITHHKLDSMPKSWAYFNATQNQLELTKNEPYKILEVQGSGHFIGCNVSLTGKSFWKSLFF